MFPSLSQKPLTKLVVCWVIQSNFQAKITDCGKFSFLSQKPLKKLVVCLIFAFSHCGFPCTTGKYKNGTQNLEHANKKILHQNPEHLYYFNLHKEQESLRRGVLIFVCIGHWPYLYLFIFAKSTPESF